MFHYKTGKARAPDEAADGFRRIWGAWVEASYRRHEQMLPHDGADQALFACGWMPWLKAHPEHPAWSWLKGFRDAVRDHFVAQGRWAHGYWVMHGVGTGMEHFTRFLAELRVLDPSDGETVNQILDAAEHLGNWVPEVPAWFDWDTGLFRSVYLGAGGAGDALRFPYNVPAHLRAVELALTAFGVSGEARYLELAVAHGGRWADALAEPGAFPVALDARGGVVRLRKGAQEHYRQFLGSKDMEGGSDVGAAEAVLAHGGVDVFLKLWQHTREGRFLAAAERVLDVLVGELVDVDAGALAAAIRIYRNFTGRTRYDDEVLQVAEYLCPYLVESQSLDLDVQVHGARIMGVGKSKDMPGWRENCQLRQHNPILLGLAAEISRNERLAASAIELACGYLVLARKALADGHMDAASARTVSAVLRGHGRDNNAGMLTAVLLPLEDVFCREVVSKPKRRTNPPFAIRIAR